MVLSNPFPGHTALTTFADLRRDLEGMVVRNAAGVMRAGVFPDHLNPLVTGRADMKLNIADFRAVQNRGGAVLLANVGTDTSVTLPAAPGANKRIDLIYVTMRSSALGDAASTPVFGYVQGDASATPVAKPLPANLSTAIPLATVEIPAGATTTLSAGVVINQAYQYTALAGGTVVVRNTVELAAWTPADGSRAFCIADASEHVRVGGAWVAQDSPWVTVLDPGPAGSVRAAYRVRNGRVEMRGVGAKAGGGSAMFTLPVGMRPPATFNFHDSMTPLGAGQQYILITSSGVVNSSNSSAAWVGFDSVHFSV